MFGASRSLFQSNSSLTGLQKGVVIFILQIRKLRLKKIHGLLKSDTGFKWEQEFELRSTGIQSHVLSIKLGYITRLCFELCRHPTLIHIQWRVGVRVSTLQADGLDLNPGSAACRLGAWTSYLPSVPQRPHLWNGENNGTFPVGLLCAEWRLVCDLWWSNVFSKLKWSWSTVLCLYRCTATSSKVNVMQKCISTLFKESFQYRLSQGNWV